MKQCLGLEEMQGHAQQGRTRLDTTQRTHTLTAERKERAGWGRTRNDMLINRGWPGYP